MKERRSSRFASPTKTMSTRESGGRCRSDNRLVHSDYLTTRALLARKSIFSQGTVEYRVHFARHGGCFVALRSWWFNEIDHRHRAVLLWWLLSQHFDLPCSGTAFYSILVSTFARTVDVLYLLHLYRMYNILIVFIFFLLSSKVFVVVYLEV